MINNLDESKVECLKCANEFYLKDMGDGLLCKKCYKKARITFSENIADHMAFYKNYYAVISICIILFSLWWFLGRKPYIEMNLPWEAGVLYNEPKWYGWETRGLIFLPKVPTEYKYLAPEAKGWWYLKRQIAPFPEGYIDIEKDGMQETVRKMEKFYKLEPLHFSDYQ